MAYKTAKIIKNDSEINRLLNRDFITCVRKAFLEIGDDKICMAKTYQNWAEKLHTFNVRDDDIFVMGFPRTGTTWSQEMVWLIANDFNFEGAKEKLLKRVPLFEVDSMFDFSDAGDMHPWMNVNSDNLTYINSLKSPRVIKTHLHWSFLPAQITDGTKHPKMIYVLRNPKDVCVSLYHLSRLMEGYRGSFDDFCELFLAGRVPNGSFWKAVLSYWKHKDRQNLLFIRYKDMIDDFPAVIKQVATFLGKNVTERQIAQLVDYLNIENMRKNPSINQDEIVERFSKPFKLMVSNQNDFIRQGKHNNYKNVMSPKLIDRFDAVTKELWAGNDLVVD